MAAVPTIIYGTAWKGDKTRSLVLEALQQGFRAIDTACQPKHYNELGVGDGIQDFLESNKEVSRNDLFIQTKFTPLSGQDARRVPYDKTKPVTEQVKQSVSVSLANLNVEYIDSLLLHSPYERLEDSLTAWKAFESFVEDGTIRYIGLSNTYDLSTLKSIYASAKIKPKFLQNRFYRETGYDIEIRNFCNSHSIQYQSFWTLTANPHALQSTYVLKVADKHKKTPEQVLYKYLQQIGVIPLSGTTSSKHMMEDVDLGSFQLNKAELRDVETALMEQ